MHSNLNENYSWWQTKIFEYKKCSIKSYKIVAENKNDDIIRTGCKAKDEVCELTNSIIVWKKDEITHDCPYEIIDQQDFQRFEGNVLRSLKQPLAFEIISKTDVCKPKPITIYTTSEGLYLTKFIKNYNGFTLKKSNTQLSTNQYLLESDEDENKIRTSKMYKELNIRNCYLLVNLLQIYKKTLYDKFFKIQDISGNELVIYSVQNKLFIPQCVDIGEIEIQETHKDCFTDLPIIWFNNGTNHTGFLTNDKIITRNSLKISCDNSQFNTYIEVENKSRAIVNS